MAVGLKTVKTIVKKITPADVQSATDKITQALKTGYKAGKSADAGIFIQTKNQTRSIYKEIKGLKFAKEEYPAVAAAVTALIPIPSPIPITPFVYGIGKIVQKIFK